MTFYYHVPCVKGKSGQALVSVIDPSLACVVAVPNPADMHTATFSVIGRTPKSFQKVRIVTVKIVVSIQKIRTRMDEGGVPCNQCVPLLY